MCKRQLSLVRGSTVVAGAILIGIVATFSHEKNEYKRQWAVVDNAEELIRRGRSSELQWSVSAIEWARARPWFGNHTCRETKRDEDRCYVELRCGEICYDDGGRCYGAWTVDLSFEPTGIIDCGAPGSRLVVAEDFDTLGHHVRWALGTCESGCSW
jgi:hypothetical protein